jgi:hypothetical protein
MKNTLILSCCVILFSVFLNLACTSDDDRPSGIIPDPGDSINHEYPPKPEAFDTNAWYLIGTAALPWADEMNQMEKSVLGNHMFQNTYPKFFDLEGLYDAIIYLRKGHFQFVKFNGSSADSSVYSFDVTEDLISFSSTYKMYHGGYGFAQNPIEVKREGLYHVYLDSIHQLFGMAPVEDFQAFYQNTNNVLVDIQLEKISNSPNRIIWEALDKIMEANRFRLRYSEADLMAPLFSYFGHEYRCDFGTWYEGQPINDTMFIAGYDYEITEQNAGIYDFRIEYFPGKGRSLKAEIIKTGDLPGLDLYDFDTVTWGITGSATRDGWNSDFPFYYKKGENGDPHKWYNVVYLQDGLFKYRINGNNSLQLQPFNSFHQGNAAGRITPQTEEFYIDVPDADGYYFINIQTADEGLSWEISIDECEWGIIGDATPGGWDHQTPLYYRGNGEWSSFVTLFNGDYLIRANNTWDLYLGGSLQNLEFQGPELNSMQNRGVTFSLKTSDKGISYSATISN